MTTMTTDRAGRWLRVSTGGQDEASQIPDVDAWCDSHGYDVTKTYLLHGKSAYKGRQDAALAEVIADMHAGRITVLVVWASDRIERRGAYNAFDLAHRVREAGGRIEYVRDAYLNDANEMSDVMLALAATKDREESRRKSERIVAKHATLRSAGSVIGRASYGHQIVTRGGIKALVPEPTEAKVLQDAAESYLNGWTLDAICDWLNGQGRLPRQPRPAPGAPFGWLRNGKPRTGPVRWVPKTLSGALRNPAVGLGRRMGDTGERDQDGKRIMRTDLKVTPILNRKTWQAVLDRMDARATRRGISQAAHPALLTSILHCGRCGRAMYRTGTGYYCRTTEPDPDRPGKRRPTCHAFIRLDQADQTAHDTLTGDHRRDLIETVVKGDDHADAIREAKRDAAEALQAEDWARLADLTAEVKRLAALPADPPRIVRRPADRTVAEVWASLPTEYERRQYLLDRGARAVYEDGWLVLNLGQPDQAEAESDPAESLALAA